MVYIVKIFKVEKSFKISIIDMTYLIWGFQNLTPEVRKDDRFGQFGDTNCCLSQIIMLMFLNDYLTTI